MSGSASAAYRRLRRGGRIVEAHAKKDPRRAGCVENRHSDSMRGRSQTAVVTGILNPSAPTKLRGGGLGLEFWSFLGYPSATNLTCSKFAASLN